MDKVIKFLKNKWTILIILIATGTTIYIMFPTMSSSANEPNDKSFKVQGNLKVTETNLNSKLAGNVAEVLVKEGDDVKAGQKIITIGSEAVQAKKTQAEAGINQAQSQYEAAQATLSAAQATYEKAQNGARPEEIEQAKIAYDYASKNLERVKVLNDEGAIPQSQYDDVFTKYSQAKEQYDMVQEGTRSEDKLLAQSQVSQAQATVETAQGKIDQAKAALAEVQTYLDDASIMVPVDGTITSINVNLGELISTGMPLASISSNETPWVELNVKETDLDKIKLKDEVSVKIAAYPEKQFTGVVTKINKKPDFATKRATSNNGEFDVLSYAVKVEVQDLDETVYPGMTVEIKFPNKADD